MVTFGKSTQTYSCGDVTAGESGALSHSLSVGAARPGCPLIRTKFRSRDQLSQKTIVFIDSLVEVESIYCCYPSRCTTLNERGSRGWERRERDAFFALGGGKFANDIATADCDSLLPHKLTRKGDARYLNTLNIVVFYT
jgi:hypothetical protein